MGAWAVIPHLLSQSQFLKLLNQPRSQHKGNEKRRDCGIDDPKAEVPEYVQERELGVQRIEPDVEHRLFLSFTV